MPFQELSHGFHTNLDLLSPAPSALLTAVDGHHLSMDFLVSALRFRVAQP